MLWRTAGEKGRGKPEYLTLFISFTLLLVVLAALSSGTRMNVGLTPVWSFISGIVWGFSLVVPGLSSSSILLFFGLYEQIMAAAGNLDMSVILPLIAGIGVVAVLFARMIDMLFEKHHGIASHAILGLVLASTIMIIPRTYQSVWQSLLCLAVAAAGFVVALYMDKWGEKIKPKE
jgi:putative membrane protein